MFVGHAALALAAKRVAPRVSLGVLVAATFGLDLLWPVFTLAGLEWFSIVPGYTAVNPLRFDHYPWSHSLAMSVGWGALAAALVWSGTRRAPDALVVGGLVVSHWALDAVSHVPDLPLWPGSAAVIGLGLWRSLAATIAVEGAIFVAGVSLYATARSRPLTAARGSLVSFLAVLLVIWLVGPFSPPPGSTSAVTWSALALVLFPIWAASIDRRVATRAGTGGPSPA